MVVGFFPPLALDLNFCLFTEICYHIEKCLCQVLRGFHLKPIM